MGRAGRGPEDSGLRSLDRMIAILKQIASSGPQGCRLTDLAQSTGLNKSTLHRLLGALARVRLLEEDGRAFLLGPELFRLGLAAAERFSVRAVAHPSVVSLAASTGDTVFLSVRAGDLSLCIDRESGPFPIKTLTLNVGDERPLGVGAGSLALLAALPDEEIDRILRASVSLYASYPAFDPPSVWSMVKRTRENGFAFNDGRIVPEMHAVAVTIQGPNGRVLAALTVAAIASRLTEGRRTAIVEQLQREAGVLHHRFKELELVEDARARG